MYPLLSFDQHFTLQLKVGWIFSHPPDREYLFSAAEVTKATELQVEAVKVHGDIGKSCVTLKVTGTLLCPCLNSYRLHHPLLQ